MTEQQLSEIFSKAFTEADEHANLSIKAEPGEIVKWIAENFCKPSTFPFTKAFTGMLDKNGTPIHEGDSVKFYHKGEYIVCTVVYDLKHAAFFIRWPDGYVNQYFMNGSSYEVVGR